MAAPDTDGHRGIGERGLRNESSPRRNAGRDDEGRLADPRFVSDPATQKRPVEPDDRTSEHTTAWSPRSEPRETMTPSAIVRAAKRVPISMSRSLRKTGSSSIERAEEFDAVVVPEWSSHFGALIVERIPVGMRGQVLDASCRTGSLSNQILRRLGPNGRVVAIDHDPTFVNIARHRAFEETGKRIFFKNEHVEHLTFSDEVFDIVVANLLVHEVEDESLVLGELIRVLKAGGPLILSRPLAGTFEEVFDMLREVAVRHGDVTLQHKLGDATQRYPSPESWRSRLEGRGLERVRIDTSERRIVFRSARELFSDQMVRMVAYPEWREILEPHENMLSEAERALDTYFDGGEVTLTAEIGIAVAYKHGG